MPFSSRSSPGRSAFLHIKCLGQSDLAFAFWKNNVENSTFISHFYHGNGVSWSSSLLDPSYRLQGCCLSTPGLAGFTLSLCSPWTYSLVLKGSLGSGFPWAGTLSRAESQQGTCFKCQYMHLCDLGGNLDPVMFGVRISFISLLLHISFKENVFIPVYFMAAKCKGDPQDLGSSLNWHKNLEDVKIRWPCLALKRFHWQSLNEITLWGSNQQALSDTRD